MVLHWNLLGCFSRAAPRGDPSFGGEGILVKVAKKNKIEFGEQFELSGGGYVSSGSMGWTEQTRAFSSTFSSLSYSAISKCAKLDDVEEGVEGADEQS